MRVLLKKACIIAPGQPIDGQIRDVLIENGVISQIAEDAGSDAQEIISGDHLHVSPGWMDVFSDFGDPGYEFKEDLSSGAQAAAAGGFTEVMLIPNTHPAIETKAQVEYILSHNPRLPATLHPIGAVSQGLKGQSLAEMYEMHRSGALAFADGLVPVQHSGLLLKALQYIKAFGGILIQIPDDTGISHHGLMHEGVWSTRLGMAGIPAIAEEIMLKRDLDLLGYTNSRLHFTGISLERSIELISRAKASGLSVSCSVTPYHLMFTDESLQQYNSHFKVTPPLREAHDVEALRQAVLDGVIDCIATHHFPQDTDSKQKEFEYASPGMIGLETCFGVLGAVLPQMKTAQLINLLAVNPRKLFGLPVPEIREGAPASITFFDPTLEWTVETKDLRSKSRNTPFLGRKLKGKVLGTYHNHQLNRN